MVLATLIGLGNVYSGLGKEKWVGNKISKMAHLCIAFSSNKLSMVLFSICVKAVILKDFLGRNLKSLMLFLKPKQFYWKQCLD